MHAIVCHRHGGPEVMRYEDAPVPEPGPGEVLLKTEAIGVNYVDTMRRSGKHPTAPKPPFTPGIEAYGRVVTLGSGVDESGLREGQPVIARCVTHGAYAEHVCAEAQFVVPCPAEIEPQQAAALFVNGQTAYHALITLGHVRRDENVLITAAAGGVGTCAVQIAKAHGARIIAAASNREKLNLVQKLGADVLVDYSQDNWPQQVLDATEGSGADLILESVGGQIFGGCLRCWATRGRLIVFGKACGTPGVITGDELLFGNRSAVGLAVGIMIEDTSLLRSSMNELFELIMQKELQMIVGETHPLRDASVAHQRLENRLTHGKVVLVP